MVVLREDKIVAIRKSSTSLNKLKSSTNKLLLSLVKGLLSILRLSGIWIKSFPDGVKKGQHIYHILKTHNLDVSSSTVYRHIQKGYLSIAPINLARAVKFKERRKNKLPSIPKEAKKGRSYEDFQNYLALN